MIIYPIYPDTNTEFPQCKFVGGIYLHGDLQDVVGYDLIQVDKSEYDKFMDMPDGVYDVDVMLRGGCSTSSILFFWKLYNDVCKRVSFRGLVVSKTDKESLMDASQKFKDRRDWL